MARSLSSDSCPAIPFEGCCLSRLVSCFCMFPSLLLWEQKLPLFCLSYRCHSYHTPPYSYTRRVSPVPRLGFGFYLITLLTLSPAAMAFNRSKASTPTTSEIEQSFIKYYDITSLVGGPTIYHKSFPWWFVIVT